MWGSKLRSSLFLVVRVLRGCNRLKRNKSIELGLIKEMLLNKMLMGIDKFVLSVLESPQVG